MAKKKQIFDINKAKEIGKMVTQPILPKRNPTPVKEEKEEKEQKKEIKVKEVPPKEKAAPAKAKVDKAPKATKAVKTSPATQKTNKSKSEELAYKRHLKYRNENVRIYCNRDLFQKLKDYAQKQRKTPKIIIEEYIESLKV